jgi:hypothetical protein
MSNVCESPTNLLLVEEERPHSGEAEINELRQALRDWHNFQEHRIRGLYLLPLRGDTVESFFDRHQFVTVLNLQKEAYALRVSQETLLESTRLNPTPS